jgi:DNA-directed RNA polymerase specialized sigma24 family protein
MRSRGTTPDKPEVNTVDLSEVPDCVAAVSPRSGGAPAFEFNHWVAFLNSREKEALTLRFVEEWEYHEIAAAQNIPIGTVQWRVFNAKRKLAPLLKRAERPEYAQAPRRGSLRSATLPQRAARSASPVGDGLKRSARYFERKAA